MKECKKCKEVKELSEFGNEKRNKDGHTGKCKVCESAKMKEWYKDNKEDKIAAYRHEHKESIATYYKEYRKKNKEVLSAKAKIYRQENKEDISAYNKDYQQEHKESIAAKKKEYQPTVNKRNKERRKTEPLFALKQRLRSRTLSSFKSKGYRKTTKTQETLGAEWEIVKKHVEKQFSKGMNWNNRSLWHIDHVIPLDSATTEKELIKLCHYTNLKPEWAEYNKSKSNKIIEGTQTNLRL